MNHSSIDCLRSRVLRLFVPALCAAWLLAGSAATPALAAILGPSLNAKLNGLAGSASVGTVIVAFNTTNGVPVIDYPIRAGAIADLAARRHAGEPPQRNVGPSGHRASSCGDTSRTRSQANRYLSMTCGLATWSSTRNMALGSWRGSSVSRSTASSATRCD